MIDLIIIVYGIVVIANLIAILLFVNKLSKIASIKCDYEYGIKDGSGNVEWFVSNCKTPQEFWAIMCIRNQDPSIKFEDIVIH